MAIRKEGPAPQPSSLQDWAAELEAAATIARSVANTAFVPDSLKSWTDEDGNPTTAKEKRFRLNTDETVATVTCALMAGQELGFKPMASLRSIDIVEGTPTLRAHALRGLLQQHGHEIAVVESTATRAIVRARRSGEDTVQQSTWTIDRARQLGVAGRKNYQTQPGTMLVNRATAEVVRWVAADVVVGLPYVDIEIADGQLDEGDEPVAIESGAKGKRKRRAAGSSSTLALPAGALPAAGGDGGSEPPAGGRTAARKISKSQLDRMHAMFRELGIERDAGLAMIRGWAQVSVTTTAELTYSQ
ncbi:MAG TPA: hypothetical protein VFF43_07435, partial [Caldimonas sp.]|nr:hypothetical protein [Caldimonas sp.]